MSIAYGYNDTDSTTRTISLRDRARFSSCKFYKKLIYDMDQKNINTYDNAGSQL